MTLSEHQKPQACGVAAGTLMNATGPWTDISVPPVGRRSYLILANYDGIETCDVAFFEGRRPDGSLWWVLGNVEIAHSCIRMYAEINWPQEQEQDGNEQPARA